MTACGRSARSILTVVACLALAGCGSTSRPGTGGHAPAVTPPVEVSIPLPAAAPPARKVAPAQLTATIEQIARGFEGKFGIAIRAVDEGWTVTSPGARQRLPQQSVSKLWVAMTLMDLRDQGKARLDDPIVVREQDLTLFHQPIAMLVKGDGYHTTVGELLTRALTHSDNTANDRLLTYVGGPGAVRGMIERKQLGDIRFGPGERLLQSKTAGLTWDQATMAKGNGFELARSRLSPEVRSAALDAYVADPPDGAAPLAIADALARLARGELFTETSTRILLDTMGASVTGRARLRAALPGGWTIAHKTGTGQDLGGRNAGFNDVGLLTAPDGRRYAIAVMIGDSRRPIRERQQLIQSVAAAVAGYAGGGA
ncbi:class A beta-lactamase-related serine hydrolase [Sphingomonas sp. RP10(2022)]|uniref:beta-lactamase n=1 Tax=Sphingomonas liriopis TaxID=2949094 RepID=A0A9X2HZ55_9SPHN|nr:serine hydrolase [Sphingomonas liriopis]MCP3735515.1 class A beta-lactamase-related serine hydrolase [Sphingomonas liriopis]